ncbi:MAG: aldo/keto reductase [Candidatus Aminicenantes bacterium]|nr:aldo/keto reductase [Candidatus Aminicenantes bacterium]
MKTKNRMDRRLFLKTSAVAAGAGILSVPAQGAEPEEKKTNPTKIKEYRTLGRTGFKASDIGVGKPLNAAVLGALLDAGVNYIDTAEGYGRGQSEKVVAEAIKNRDRKSLFINSKLSMRGNPSKEQILSRAYKCLDRLQTGYLDCMMMHSCGNVEAVKYKPFHDAMAQLKKEKKLRFVGLSNHGGNYNDVSESMEKVLLAAAADGRFDVMLLVYNFLKRDMGEKVLEVCRKKNIGTTLMKVNPVGSYHAYKERFEEAEKKGQPTERLKGLVARMKKRAGQARDFIKKHNLTDNEAIRSAAYRFVLDNKNAHSALFNFSNFEQVDSMLGISGTGFSGKDQKTLSALSQGCGDLYCRHACGACESKCPAGVPVNTIMRYHHYFDAQGREKHALQKYAALPTAKADRCFQCSGMCETACPYGVPIQGLLMMAHGSLTLA